MVYGIRIALADDQSDLRVAMSALLTHLGYTVVCSAANGEELLAACDQVAVDVALVDLDMPVMDGLTTAAHLSDMRIPVVLMSGHPDVEHVVIESEPIATRVLKPVSAEVLREAIEFALQNRNRQPDG